MADEDFLEETNEDVLEDTDDDVLEKLDEDNPKGTGEMKDLYF